MKKIDSIIESSEAPRTNCLWLKDGNLQYFSSSGWKNIKGSGTINWADINDKPTFATVATSGSYNDLSDIPNEYTLPNATINKLGGVKQANAIANLATSADAPTIVTTVNALLTALRTAGIISNS